MILTISTTHTPATDLSFLLHKHPDRLQAVDLSAGKAHIFYSEVSEDKCTVALLLDIDPIGLIRHEHHRAEAFSLAGYVNDRPYVASSFLSVALAKAFSTAMNGTCANRPELVDLPMPFEVTMAALPAPRGGEVLIKKLFEPLGYAVMATGHPLDSKFPEWGDSKYFTVKLTGTTLLKLLLSHLYVLIPVLDTAKHYFVGQHEVEKLLVKGAGWLPQHPEKEQITRRYLKGIGGFTRNALNRLTDEEAETLATEDAEDEGDGMKRTLHEKRLVAVLDVLKEVGAKSVIDLGCGEGKLLRLLLKDKTFEEILGMDVSYRSLERAAARLGLDYMAPRQKERITLIQGALTYRDKRLQGFDAAALVEVIEHLDEDRLKAFERVVFAFARPKTVVLTTPNREYNDRYETLTAGAMRHSDHRFEWTRRQFAIWAKAVANEYGYMVQCGPLGDEDETVGAPSQMAIFKLLEDKQ